MVWNLVKKFQQTKPFNCKQCRLLKSVSKGPTKARLPPKVVLFSLIRMKFSRKTKTHGRVCFNTLSPATIAQLPPKVEPFWLEIVSLRLLLYIENCLISSQKVSGKPKSLPTAIKPLALLIIAHGRVQNWKAVEAKNALDFFSIIISHALYLLYYYCY